MAKFGLSKFVSIPLQTKSSASMIKSKAYGGGTENRSHGIGGILGIGRVLALFQPLIHLSAARWAPLPLRLIVGYGFTEHGFAKLLRGPENFAGLLQALGTPEWLTIATEIVGGFCVLLGALVPLVSIPMAIVLLVAIFTVHLPNGFSSIKLQSVTATGAHFGQPGYETDLLYLACLVTLVLGGSGPFAVDNWLFRWLDAAARNADGA
jgi:putative oxidoreductase